MYDRDEPVYFDYAIGKSERFLLDMSSGEEFDWPGESGNFPPRLGSRCSIFAPRPFGVGADFDMGGMDRCH